MGGGKSDLGPLGAEPSAEVADPIARRPELRRPDPPLLAHSCSRDSP